MSENTYNVVSVNEYLESTANAARFGAAYWRTSALAALGEQGPWSKQDLQRASGLDSDTLRHILPPLFRELTEFAVSRQGIAHKDAIASVQTHLRNAFSSVKGATARFKDKPDLSATSQYSGDDAVYRIATRNTGVDTGYSAMIGIKLKTREDVLDATKETDKGIGDEASGDHVKAERDHEKALAENDNNVDHHVPMGTGTSEPSEQEPEPVTNGKLADWQREHGKRTRALRASLDRMEQRNEELLTLLKVNNRLLKKAKQNLA